MLLLELFDEYRPDDIVQELRDDIIDFLMPLAANGVPYVSMGSIIDKLRDRRSGIEVDRALVMQVLDPDVVKLVTKIEGDRVYFKLPTPADRDVPQDQEEKEKQKVTKTAAKQAQKNLKAESVLYERKIGTIQSRHAAQETDMFQIHSRVELEALLRRATHRTLRLMLEDDALLAWDAEFATHRNAEETFGSDGARMSITRRPDGKNEIEYNINDIKKPQIVRHPVIQKLFKPEELATMNFVSVEI